MDTSAAHAPAPRRNWERYAPLAGVLAVAFVLLGILLRVFGANEPGEESSPQEILAFFRDDENWIFVSSFFAGIGLLLFVWFLGSLRSRLHLAEGGSGRLAAVAFGGGLATTILLFAALAPQVSGAAAIQSRDISPEAAEALWHTGDGFFPAAFLASALPLAATALVVLRTRALPRWLGWASAVLALAMLIPFINWLAFGFVFPLWVIVVSLLLWREHGRLSTDDAYSGRTS
jgi:hypothetical protein